jgi:hypothetical protein
MSNTPPQTGSGPPEDENTGAISPLRGLDRGGLGANGWAEVPADRIGGHPEFESAPKAGPDGRLNGPQPDIDPCTGTPLLSTE